MFTTRWGRGRRAAPAEVSARCRTGRPVQGRKDSENRSRARSPTTNRMGSRPVRIERGPASRPVLVAWRRSSPRLTHTIARHGWRRARHSSDHRGVLRQPRHRHRQVRRLHPHRVGLDARRVDPLGGRHRQPGPPAARRPPGPQGAHGALPVRLRPGALLLVVRRGARALQPRLALRRLRGHPQARAPRAPRVAGRSPTPSSAWPSCSRASRCARQWSSHGIQRISGLARVHPHAPRRRSSRWCCSRTSAPRRGW